MKTAALPALLWAQRGSTHHAYTEDKTLIRPRFRASSALPFSGDALLGRYADPFAIVRPERGAGGGPDASTGRWLVTLSAHRTPAGMTSFDMTTSHESLQGAKVHVEALFALQGLA